MPALNLPYLCSIILADGELDVVAAQSRERFLNDAATPRVESARVTLTLDDGSRQERFLDHVKGFPANVDELVALIAR